MDEADKGTMRGVRRSLVGQSVGIAAVCLICDGADFAFLGPLVRSPFGLVMLATIILVDAALALPARFSGWVALAHGLGGILLLGGNYSGRLIAGYRAGAWLRGWSAPASLVALAAGLVLSRTLVGHWNPVGVCLQVGTNALLPWLVGRYTTARRAYIDEMRHRREVEARDAAAEVEKAVARERTAIARDLHDVISHHVSAIGVHAGAARMKLGGANAGNGVLESLAAVEASSRSAMVDLRTMLDLLHGAADTTNQPGLDNLEELLQNVRRSGLATRLTVLGVPRAVPGSLDIALYRISQEMLTNALRHGDGTLVDVEISYADGSITLAARNGIGGGTRASGTRASGTRANGTRANGTRANGTRANGTETNGTETNGTETNGTETNGTGRGLAGIRTRAAMFAGVVSHGPDEDNRCWETTVTVPIEGAS